MDVNVALALAGVTVLSLFLVSMPFVAVMIKDLKKKFGK